MCTRFPIIKRLYKHIYFIRFSFSFQLLPSCDDQALMDILGPTDTDGPSNGVGDDLLSLFDNVWTKPEVNRKRGFESDKGPENKSAEEKNTQKWHKDKKYVGIFVEGS